VRRYESFVLHVYELTCKISYKQWILAIMQAKTHVLSLFQEFWQFSYIDLKA